MYFIAYSNTVKKFKFIICEKIQKKKFLIYKKVKIIFLYFLTYGEFEFEILYTDRVGNEVHL
jgi:hypothetical protein